MEAATKGDGLITAAQISEAERRLIGFLHAKHFPREWIESHVPEVMAWAQSDFAARLAAGREDETVNLLVIIGYRRALKILRGDHCGPPTTSLETLFHVADESTPSPEDEAIEHDRQERVMKALSRLPERERKMLALVYYEGMSIRQAGLRVGWKKSVADRHHKAALGRLEALLDRSLLAPEIAIPAYIAAFHDSAPRNIVMWIKGAVETIREMAMLASGRIAPPLAEPGNAAALSGASRGAAGVCGAAVLVCLAGAATGVVGPGVEALAPGGAASKASPKSERGKRVSTNRPVETVPRMSTPQVAESPQPRRARRSSNTDDTQTPVTSPRAGADRRERPAGATAAPNATTRQTVNEFGVESGEVESSPPPVGSEAVEAAPISPAPPAAARPELESSENSSTPSGGDSSSGSSTSSEFGM